MIRNILKWAARPLWRRLAARVDAAVDARLRAYGYPLPYQAPPHLPTLDELHGQRRLFVPPCPPGWPVTSPFMAHSTCSSADLMHPEFERLCRSVEIPVHYHRKLWEWVFIVHHLEQAGVLREGASGLGFGVGRETLPAFFAQRGVEVLATDAPPEIGERGGWSATAQHAEAIESLYHPKLIDRATFDARVRFRRCDMNAIPADIGRFDFTWSSCCFEHLGDLEAGLRFVEDSVEKCLKPGGVAVHTTEFNLSSNDETVSEGETVIYRKRDLEGLVRRLRDRGHDAHPFTVAPDSHYLDGFVDVPPYTHSPHLKLQIERHVVTSAGIVVRRGA
jgi:hypothetical protein